MTTAERKYKAKKGTEMTTPFSFFSNLATRIKQERATSKALAAELDKQLTNVGMIDRMHRAYSRYRNLHRNYTERQVWCNWIAQ